MKFFSQKHALVCLSFFSLCACAENINFACSGTGNLTGIGSYPESINVTVDTSNGAMWGFQGGLVPGCRGDGVFRSKVYECKINSTEASCSCSNELGISSINFSRVTGELKTYTQILDKGQKGKIMSGTYACKKIAKNAF